MVWEGMDGGVGGRTTSVRPYEMVRGRCPRDMIRGVVDGGGWTVGDVGASGHADHPQQPHPGSHATTGRRGRPAPYGRQRYIGVGIVVNRCANAASLRPPLGSPERGAVAARSGVTEGLVPALVRRNHVIRQPHPTVGAGFHARPAWVDGRRGFARYPTRISVCLAPARKGRRPRRPAVAGLPGWCCCGWSA